MRSSFIIPEMVGYFILISCFSWTGVYCYIGIDCDFNVSVALCRTRLELLVVSVGHACKYLDHFLGK